nr:adenosylcobinamide-GDP ribazoletransferase [Streptomyces sp. SID8367]
MTVLPVRVTRWDRAAARAGMLSAPLAGLVVGLGAAALGVALSFLGAGALLCAVASVAVPAVLTRGLHLDGLADVADGLGSGKPAEDALRIMKQSDIGPFGVVTLVLALLAQVAVLGQMYADSWVRGAVAAGVCAVTARLALTFASRAGVPAARPEGLGAAVAETVPVRGALVVGAVVVAVVAGVSLQGAAAVVLGCGAGELMLRRCVSRFGGVTGDVFGAVAEVAGTAALVTLSL